MFEKIFSLHKKLLKSKFWNRWIWWIYWNFIPSTKNRLLPLYITQAVLAEDSLIQKVIDKNELRTIKSITSMFSNSEMIVIINILEYRSYSSILIKGVIN